MARMADSLAPHPLNITLHRDASLVGTVTLAGSDQFGKYPVAYCSSRADEGALGLVREHISIKELGTHAHTNPAGLSSGTLISVWKIHKLQP